MKKLLVIPALAMLTSTAFASPTNFSLGYENNKALGKEGVVLDVNTNTSDYTTLGLNVLGNKSKLQSAGIYVGVPLNTKYNVSGITVVPSLGIDYAVEAKQFVVVPALRGSYAVSPDISLTGQVKYLKGLANVNGSTTDKVSGTAYSVGITKTF